MVLINIKCGWIRFYVLHITIYFLSKVYSKCCWFHKDFRYQEEACDDDKLISLHEPNDKRFAMELFHQNGSCFMWSCNPLMRDAWIPFNCTYKVPKPFIVCEGKSKAKPAPKKYNRPYYKCAQMFQEFKENCIRVTIYNKLRTGQIQLENGLTRIFTTWTIRLHHGKKVRHCML